MGGAERRVENVRTVGDVKAEMGVGKAYQATVNGSPAGDNHPLGEDDFVSLAPAVKGG